eukprot:Rhum_TRINITY_DN26225_c0_g1::Rhum_TRINITY_DN26225_c0_g1_i1::g.183492::m.183492
MIFEVADLAVASPATVSRCGMVYMDFVELGWMPTVYTWLRTHMPPFLGPAGSEYVYNLMETKLTLGHKWLRTQGKQLIAGAAQNMTRSCVDLFHALCVTQNVEFPPEAPGDAEENPEVTQQRKELINTIFAFCFVWSIGGNVDDKSRDVFDVWCREALEDVAMFSGPN